MNQSGLLLSYVYRFSSLFHLTVTSCFGVYNSELFPFLMRVQWRGCCVNRHDSAVKQARGECEQDAAFREQRTHPPPCLTAHFSFYCFISFFFCKRRQLLYHLNILLWYIIFDFMNILRLSQVLEITFSHYYPTIQVFGRPDRVRFQLLRIIGDYCTRQDNCKLCDKANNPATCEARFAVLFTFLI